MEMGADKAWEYHCLDVSLLKVRQLFNTLNILLFM